MSQNNLHPSYQGDIHQMQHHYTTPTLLRYTFLHTFPLKSIINVGGAV